MITRKVVIVDDEPAARKNLREVINTFSELTLAAEINNGPDAIKQINEVNPDILFLDIEMPGMNGFSVANATEHLKYQLVFVTAFKKYALEAFETRAIDYLMKPVRPELLKKCIEKILLQEKMAREALEQTDNQKDVLVLTDGKKRRVVSQHHICFIEGIGRYRQLHLTVKGQERHKMKTIVSDTTLEAFEETLPDDHFLRIHRGYIVNIQQIVRLFIKARRYVVTLNDHGDSLPVSRNKISQVRVLLDQK